MSNLDIDELLQSIDETEKVAKFRAIVEEIVQQRLVEELTAFQQAVDNSNLAAIQVMQEALSEQEEEFKTLTGVVKKLQQAVAPDIEPIKDVTSIQDAITNIKKYGVIVPSRDDVILAQNKAKNQKAWSLVMQAIASFLINQLFQSKTSKSNE